MPILCVLGARGRILTDVAVEGLDHAVKAMTANGFLNLENVSDDEQGNARVRRIVGKPLPGHPLVEPRRRASDPAH